MWAVLLTSCVRTADPLDKRKEYYLRAIHDWLIKTTLPIFVVESSGYTFPEIHHPRLKVCSFNLENEPTLSHYEAKSILYAMEYFKEDLIPYTHILKVTARYFIPIEPVLAQVPPHIDIVLQYSVNHAHKWNFSEFFGFKKGTEQIFLKNISTSALMEQVIYQFSTENATARFPPFENEYRVERGGDKLILKFL
jgi:hypothetical protein